MPDVKSDPITVPITGGFDYDSIETGYYDRVFHKKAGIQSKWHHLKFAHIRAQIGEEAHHLDIGCGPGTFIGSISDIVNSVGVDVAAPQIDHARVTYGSECKKFELIKPGNLPFDDGTFDVATCIELIEHLTPRHGLDLLVEAKRVIKPGGNLLLTTPDYGGAWPLLERILNRRSSVSYEHQHITHFTAASLKIFLELAGFESVKIERYQFLSPFLAPLGWAVSDLAAKIEPKWLTSHFGFLLFAKASPSMGA